MKKECGRCHRLLDRDVRYFGSSLETKDGFARWCRDCNRAASTRGRERERGKALMHVGVPWTPGDILEWEERGQTLRAEVRGSTTSGSDIRVTVWRMRDGRRAAIRPVQMWLTALKDARVVGKAVVATP